MSRLLAIGDSAEVLEGFSWQYDNTRRFLAELDPDVPEVAHLNGIVMAVPMLGGEIRDAGLRMNLTAYAYFLEHEGRFDEALDVLQLAAAVIRPPGLQPPEFTAFALAVARLRRLLGKWDTALATYRQAEQSAASVGDYASVLRARLGRVAVLCSQGNLPRARIEVEDVVATARADGIDGVLSEAYLDLGLVLAKQGFKIDSLRASYEAVEHAKDDRMAARILGDLGVGLVEIGEYQVSRLAFELVLVTDATFTVRTNALIELMALESLSGNRVAFERYRLQGREVAERMPPGMALDFEFKSAIGLSRFGQRARARQILAGALRQAEAHQLNEWYFRIERVMAGLEACAEAPCETTPPDAEASDTSVIAEMAIGLRRRMEAIGA